MKFKATQKIVAVFFVMIICGQNSSAQTLQIKAENYLQVFEGAGISSGLYLGHHYSMPSAASQDLAVQYIANDLNMRYLQDYININPADDPAYFDRRANYILACKAYKPDIKVSQVGNKFPADLMVDSFVGGQVRKVLNTRDTAIYTKVASWYFELFKAFKVRGVQVDILNVVNEPDFDKVYYYGADGQTMKNVALIFDKAVTKFFAMLDNPAINTLAMPKPKIMGPSTISPTGCLQYIAYFKANYPQVWNSIDIVAYHQYVNGVNVGDLATIKSEAGTKPVFQSEMHTNRGDALGTLPITDELRGCLSLASVFGNSMRTGCNSWFYFQTNYPDTYTPAGLLSIPWQAASPTRYKHYYAFKQLTTAQPFNSNMLEHLKANLPKVDIFSMRKQGTDSIYVHASNQEGVDRQITLNVTQLDGSSYYIKKYQIRTTNENLNDAAAPIQSFSVPVTQIVFTLLPYSVNTIAIDISKTLNTTGISSAVLLGQKINVFHSGSSITLQSSTNNPIKGFQLVNSSGQVMHKVSNIRQATYILQNVNMPKGVYFFQISTNNGMAVKKYLSTNY